jgi:anti-sigma regulatory factor (Ser/Thr protein kinase)
MAVDDRSGLGAADDPSAMIVVPHHPQGASIARQRLAAELALRTELNPGLVSDVIAVGAELLGNAVRHAEPLPGGVIQLTWQIDRSVPGGRVTVRVADGGALQMPAQRTARPDDVDGRGLTIVAALAMRWGVERNGAGQVVWAVVGPTFG